VSPAEPRCMTPREIEAWWAADRLIRGERTHAVSPCSDCSRLFAEGMRMVNRCDGLYPGEMGPEPVRVWAYATEADRLEARRRTWRDSSRSQRAQTTA
jgi:hypothetical protein